MGNKSNAGNKIINMRSIGCCEHETIFISARVAAPLAALPSRQRKVFTEFVTDDIKYQS